MNIQPIEQAAAGWHEQRQVEHEEADEFSGCWCCCVYCELNNPHFADAQSCNERPPT